MFQLANVDDILAVCSASVKPKTALKLLLNGAAYGIKRPQFQIA